MKRNLSYTITMLCLAAILASCGSSAPRVDYQALAQASIKLGMDIDRQDNHKLYINAARWIGTPYRPGGNNAQGIDCSGLTTQLYKETYRIHLPRSTSKQKFEVQRLLTIDELREGDLVFFNSHTSSKKATHVGIYLKDWKFIHASSSRGVIVSSLLEDYYKEHWICGGRYK